MWNDPPIWSKTDVLPLFLGNLSEILAYFARKLVFSLDKISPPWNWIFWAFSRLVFPTQNFAQISGHFGHFPGIFYFTFEWPFWSNKNQYERVPNTHSCVPVIFLFMVDVKRNINDVMYFTSTFFTSAVLRILTTLLNFTNYYQLIATWLIQPNNSIIQVSNHNRVYKW